MSGKNNNNPELTWSWLETKELKNLRPKSKCGKLIAAKQPLYIDLISRKENRNKDSERLYLLSMKKDPSKQTTSSSPSFISIFNNSLRLVLSISSLETCESATARGLFRLNLGLPPTWLSFYADIRVKRPWVVIGPRSNSWWCSNTLNLTFLIRTLPSNLGQGWKSSPPLASWFLLKAVVLSS